jgi:hypothetical protein
MKKHSLELIQMGQDLQSYVEVATSKSSEIHCLKGLQLA